MSNLNLTLRERQEKFFTSQKFALAGASSGSNDRCGNKVLRWLIGRYGRTRVVPVHPSAETLEGIPCVAKLSSLPDPEQTALGIVTQPYVTRKLLEEANRLKIRMTWIQPGAEDDSVRQYIREAGMEDRVIYSTGNELGTIASYNQESPWEGSAKNHIHYDAGTGPPCGSDTQPDIITNGNNLAP